MITKKKEIRVYLRGLEIEDYVKIHEWRQDEEIGKNFGGVRLFSSSLNVKKWVESKIYDESNVSAAICLKENDEFIGLTFLSQIDHHNRSGHCPIFIGEKKQWGKGYATDARILILKYAFYERGLERIWARVLEENKGSLKMCEKTGFKIEGLLRKSKLVDGNLKNQYILSLLREDFEIVLSQYSL